MDLFFYGTLMDDDVLAAVTGRRPPSHGRRPARLAGYRRVYRRGAAYPVLLADPAGAVEGLLTLGLGAEEVDRLIAFEGSEYRLAQVQVVVDGGVAAPAVVGARTFLSRPEVPATATAWRLEAWQAREKAAFLARVRTHHRPR